MERRKGGARTRDMHVMSKRRPLPPSLTVAFETLVDETVEQRSAVVAERRTRVGVYFELVTGRVLEGGEEEKNIS